MITGYEYTYDEPGRIIEESHIANNIKMCYTYDNLSRVTMCTKVNLADNSEILENFSYDASGNLTFGVYIYDRNNRLTSYDEQCKPTSKSRRACYVYGLGLIVECRDCKRKGEN